MVENVQFKRHFSRGGGRVSRRGDSSPSPKGSKAAPRPGAKEEAATSDRPGGLADVPPCSFLSESPKVLLSLSRARSPLRPPRFQGLSLSLR